ncbi:ATP-binding protein [Planktothrix agardhii]|uniref:ATP-binding protein n=1 Tax=Planktothrix agardhii TaxID=1160 RepID=UPI0028ADDF6F|nr:ATP-binding protein [Planktothrix agardhii]
MLISTKNQPPVLYVDTIEDYPRHVEMLLKDWYDILQLPQNCRELIIDFHYCGFLGHIGATFLGGIVRLFEYRGGNVKFRWNTLIEKIRVNLAQNGFLYDFSHYQKPWDGNSVPYRRDIKHDPIAIADYLGYKWLGKGWVNISPGLQNLIAGKVVEIYFNAFEHSQSPIGVFSCGQHYTTSGTVQLTVVDFGIGISNSVRTLPENAAMTSIEALKWAFEPGNSTKQQGIRQGEGLHILQEFVQKNHGNLMIFSNDSYVNIGDNGVRYENICTNFSGTLVNIAFRCDEKYYCLASEVPKLKKLKL